MTKTSNYWDRRALRRLTDAEKISEEHITRIKKIYEQAYRDVSKEIERTYKAYAKDTGLDVDKLRELLTKKETDKVWKTLKRQGLDKYIKNNYKSRISRLEQIQAQIYGKAKLIYPKEEFEQTMAYKGVINDSYYKAIYDTQKGLGYDFSFNKIDNNTINLLLNEKWSGLNYSQRIWKNTDYLADALSYTIGGAMLSGQSIEKTTRQIKERFNVSKYYAERLVRTETNHFHNEADAMAYESMDIKKYVFVATLDSRTSEICQNHDNKVYNYKDKETGVNYPPLHPNCRSKTRGYISEEVERTLKRRARNPITGKTEVIDNISYKDWAKKNGLIAPKMTVKSDKIIKKPTENTQKLTKTPKVQYNTSTLLEKLDVKVEDYKPFGKYDPYENTIQENASKVLGYDKKPKVLNEEDFNKIEGISIVRNIHGRRGQTAKEIFENTINGNIQYSDPTDSTFGRAIYFGDKEIEDKIINDYATRYKDNYLIDAKISKTANIVEYDTLLDYTKDLANRLDKVPADLRKIYGKETSLLYMLEGIDGIHLKYNNYYCIYNRGELIIKNG